MTSANETVANLRNETVANLLNQTSETGQNIVHKVRVRGRPHHVPPSDQTGWDPVPVSEYISTKNNENVIAASNRLKAAMQRTQRQINYEQDVMMDKELKYTKIKKIL